MAGEEPGALEAGTVEDILPHERREVERSNHLTFGLESTSFLVVTT
jgi:hypothetical protein